MLWVSRKLVAATGAPVASAALAAAAFNVTFDAVPVHACLEKPVARRGTCLRLRPGNRSLGGPGLRGLENLWRAGVPCYGYGPKQEPRWPGYRRVSS